MIVTYPYSDICCKNNRCNIDPHWRSSSEDKYEVQGTNPIPSTYQTTSLASRQTTALNKIYVLRRQKRTLSELLNETPSTNIMS
ncbi:hypothetical protein Mp_3g02390 [Marchantia polymorpha subsp. ruderalis]|uniref:Uncharacterized protein n=2 Tax=Marchantia polymorpha TaxID=3197 RepID=A0AAF6AWP3_MARPO|nr:hypothetical protein MARPO_0007s0228 [Marchantia polymorpha]BBN04177.1 hypothetical protein Mp_3g02390 [Marchantia polymorpha subsp. ruderalis]|eukprot:PTQ47864.1 hypothetical protein MARPO_0007s0228 [Marchantia polymorpha]